MQLQKTCLSTLRDRSQIIASIGPGGGSGSPARFSVRPSVIVDARGMELGLDTLGPVRVRALQLTYWELNSLNQTSLWFCDAGFGPRDDRGGEIGQMLFMALPELEPRSCPMWNWNGERARQRGNVSAATATSSMRATRHCSKFPPWFSIVLTIEIIQKKN